MAKRYFTELEAPPGYDYEPSPDAAPPDGGGKHWRERLKGLLSRVKLRPRLPSRQGWGLFILWTVLALSTCQVLGAFLVPQLEAPWQVFAVAFGLTFGLPLLIAPRPNRDPLVWGIGLNVLALVALALLGRPTQEALSKHGSWAVDWLEQRATNVPTVLLFKGITAFTRVGVSLVPVEQLETMFGPLRLEEPGVQPQQTGGSNRGRRTAGGSTTPGAGAATGASAGAVKPEPFAQAAHEVSGGGATSADRPEAPGDIGRWEARLAELINLERTRHGLPALRVRDDLCRVARAHSDAMKAQHFVGHVDPAGMSAQDRARAELKDEHLQGDAPVAVAVGRVKDSSDPARDLINAILRAPAERIPLLDETIPYRGAGVGISCDGPTCFGTVLFLR